MQSAFFKGLLAALYLATDAPQLACADTLTQAKMNIQAMYLQKNTATERKDIAGIMRIYTLNATVKYPNGKVISRSQLENELVSILPSVKSVVGHDFVKNVTLKGNTAFVQSSKNSTTVSENSHTHKLDRVVNSARAEDTWVKIGKKWFLQQVRIVSASATVNGKPMVSD